MIIGINTDAQGKLDEMLGQKPLGNPLNIAQKTAQQSQDGEGKMFEHLQGKAHTDNPESPRMNELGQWMNADGKPIPHPHADPRIQKTSGRNTPSVLIPGGPQD